MAFSRSFNSSVTLVVLMTRLIVHVLTSNLTRVNNRVGIKPRFLKNWHLSCDLLEKSESLIYSVLNYMSLSTKMSLVNE